MSDKAAGQKAPSPEGCDENGPAASLLLGHLSIQICSFVPPVRLGPPCRRPILIATPLHQSMTCCTRCKSPPSEPRLSRPIGPGPGVCSPPDRVTNAFAYYARNDRSDP